MTAPPTRPGLPHSSSLLGPNPSLSLTGRGERAAPPSAAASAADRSPHHLDSNPLPAGSTATQAISIPGSGSLAAHSSMATSPLRHDAVSADHAWQAGSSPRKPGYLGVGSPGAGPAGMERIPSGPGATAWTAGDNRPPSLSPAAAASVSPAHHTPSPLNCLPHAPSHLPAPSPFSLHLAHQQGFFHPPHHPSPLHPHGGPSQNHTPLLAPPPLPVPLAPGDTRTQLFVGNLPFRVRWQDLKDLFRKCGTVLRADVALTLENRSKGFGTVLFANRDDAARATETYNGFNWQTRVLDVRLDSQDPTGAHALAIANAANAAQAAAQAQAAAAATGMASTPSPRLLPHRAGGVPTMTAGPPPPMPMPQYHGMLGIPTGGQAMSRRGSDDHRPGTAGGLANEMEAGGQEMARSASHPPPRTGPSPPRPGPGSREPSSGPVMAPSTTPMYDPIPQGMGQQQVMVPFMYAYPGMPPPGGLMSFYGGRPAALPIQYANRHLFVGNLPFNCQWQDLKDLFRNAGHILRADVAMGPDGRSRGFGTVLFATPEDAQNAVGMYNGYEYNGRALKVHFDKFAQPGAPGAATPPVYAAAGGGGIGSAMQQQLGSGVGMGRTPSNQSHPMSDLRVSSASFQMPPRPASVAEPRWAHPDPTGPEGQGPVPSPFFRQGPGPGLARGEFAVRHPDTWSFQGEHTIDEPNGAAPDVADVSPTQPATAGVEDASAASAAATKAGKERPAHKPMSIAMPPPYMVAGDGSGGMMSPPLGKGMGVMTPSMPAFSFQPFPQTPPLMPAQFFSPGIGGLGPFSPPIQSPGWAAPPSAGAVAGPGYNPMFPPTGSYDPTPGGAHIPHDEVDTLGDGHHGMNGYGAHSLGGAMDQLSLESQPVESQPLESVDSTDSSHSSTTNGPTAGSKVLTASLQQQARRASFFGAPGAEKQNHHHHQGGRTGQDRLVPEDLGAGRRASFESGAAAFLGSGRRVAEEV